MSYRSGSRSRALVLGLSITSMGAQAIAAEPMVAALELDLSGLVAADNPSAVANAASVQPQGCDPSGCGTAYFTIRDFRLDNNNGGSPGYGDISTAFISAMRYYGATVVDAELDVSVVNGAEIVAAPGCVVLNPQLATCALGDLVDSTETANTVSFKLLGSATAQIQASLRSPTQNSWTGNSGLTIYSVSGLNTGARMTRIEKDACPLVSADLSYVQNNGESAWASLSGLIPRVLERDDFVPSAFEDAMPLSIALVIDDSAGASAASWQSAKTAAAGFVQDWAAWAVTKEQPFPPIAIYGMASRARLIDYSTEASSLAAGILALPQRQRGGALYATLDQASADLAARSGRRVAVVLATATDSGGGVLRDSAQRHLLDAQVNVYGVAIDPLAEPILRDLAKASSGFRQRADLDGGTYSALGKISRQIRSERRVSWITPDAIASYRPLLIQLNNNSGSNYAAFSDGYTPSGAVCSSACRVVRQVPERVAPLATFPVQLNFPATVTEYTTIVEQLPYGVGVSAVSSGGYYNDQSRTITWSLPVGSAGAGVSYLATAPFEQAVPPVWGGRSSSAGSSASTCGEARLNIATAHPSSSYFFNSIDPVRLRAYVKAWRYGSPWLVDEDVMIRAAYVTRGYQIMRGSGAGYDYQPEADVPWLSSDPGAVVATVQSRARTLPASFTSGVAFPVILTYTSSNPAGAGAIEESPPAGWMIDNISDGGVYDTHSRTIRWGVFTGTVNRNVSYMLTPPAAASDPAVFDGRVSVDGNDAPFTETTLSSTANDVIWRNGFDG